MPALTIMPDQVSAVRTCSDCMHQRKCVELWGQRGLHGSWLCVKDCALNWMGKGWSPLKPSEYELIERQRALKRDEKARTATLKARFAALRAARDSA